MPFELDTGVDQRGKLSVHGKVALAPLTVDAGIDASKVAVGWIAGYLGDRLNIAIDSGDLDTRGMLHFAEGKSPEASSTVSYRGSLRVTRMRSRDRITSEPFVEWQTLDVPTIDLQMPGPHAPLAVTLGKVTLDDFYARLIVNGNGRLNLQDVVSTPGERQSVTKPEADGKPAPVAPPAPTNAPRPAIVSPASRLRKVASASPTTSSSPITARTSPTLRARSRPSHPTTRNPRRSS